MKAYVVPKAGPLDTIAPIEIKKPTVGSDEVLISVKGAALNPADVKVAMGLQGGGFIHSSKKPIQLGFDFCGLVTEIGSEATAYSVGDRVYGFLPYSSKTTQGSFAEFVCVAANGIAKAPKLASDEAAAAMATVGSTALQALMEVGNLQKGDRILINGASGGVGCFAAQIARLYNAEVWGTASSGSLDFIASHGVNFPLDYNTDWKSELKGEFDIILDAASNLAFTGISKFLKSDGTYVTLLPSLGFVVGIVASLFSSKKCRLCVVKAHTESLATLARFVNDQKMIIPLAATFEVNKLKDGLEMMKAGGTQGKIGITMDVNKGGSN